MIYRQKAKKPKNIRLALKTKINMKGILRGCLFCASWYLSIIAGFFLLICPILPLAIISPKAYRRLSDLVFGMWEPFPVALMEICMGTRVVLTGDAINLMEGSLFLMNHRTRIDWNFLWLGLYHSCRPNAHNIKYILKSPLRHFPGLGWVMQTCAFIFLYRDWKRDKMVLDIMIDYLNESDDLYQILLFPEGTDITEKTLKKSHKYADEHNLERYYNVLHPRTTGFVFLVNKMKSAGNLEAIYDVTVAYPKTITHTEFELVKGKFPEEVHFHVKRYSPLSIPKEEEELKSWLCNIWRDKEKDLQRFNAFGFFSNKIPSETLINNRSDQNIDYGKGSMQNGVIKYEEASDAEEAGRESVKSISQKAESKESVQPGTSSNDEKNTVMSAAYIKKLENVDQKSKPRPYRPPHVLYLILGFWYTLILITVHQLFCNTYFQIWVFTHSLLFIALSVVSNGFQHLVASFYFYRHERKISLQKKSE